MSGITLVDAQTQLAAWLAASSAVAGNQSYAIGERSLTRADASEIRRQIEFWDGKVSQLSAQSRGRGRKLVLRPNF